MEILQPTDQGLRLWVIISGKLSYKMLAPDTYQQITALVNLPVPSKLIYYILIFQNLFGEKVCRGRLAW